ncbi:hypothetical protein Nepgr_024751 [Nepenthes gracilis]|uniref:Uncharacterized protein n=1 Tax=Nepenthes gracilis TaxID=150966 RepID=A0AAD3T3G1_NEPGR|nr:hypothetical protein Nepgr_024751 [Nepenthes gracilis]
MDSCVAIDPQNPSGVLHLPNPLSEVPPKSNLDASKAPDEICTKDAAHVKQLDPADADGQRRTQIEKRLQVLDAGVGGLDDYPPSRPPDTILTGLEPEAGRCADVVIGAADSQFLLLWFDAGAGCVALMRSI